MRRWARRAAIAAGIVLALFAAFIVAIALRVPWAWDLLFRVAYCLDGYGGCP